jgi:hypothetical protein
MCYVLCDPEDRRIEDYLRALFGPSWLLVIFRCLSLPKVVGRGSWILGR